MPNFLETFDTSGSISCFGNIDPQGNINMSGEGPKGGAILEWSNLDSFTQGYIEALFFTAGDTMQELGFADLAPEALISIMEDCAKFQSPQGADQILSDCYMRGGYSPEQAGRDFWFTRNRHGVGFWDREPLKADGWRDVLTGISQDEFGEVEAYIGDDGLMYLSS